MPRLQVRIRQGLGPIAQPQKLSDPHLQSLSPHFSLLSIRSFRDSAAMDVCFFLPKGFPSFRRDSPCSTRVADWS